ncbi:hypothetical protein Stube_41680 [Streptomyces tubercidicus]|uniref:Uncharacterized protein n=1 Tax=Streptomyces tubercidicus TaxID=47759 RepID=A0A640UY81_9ACTN|nr:hypothetical protein Stube_41680 [Streptomyces tubercidicus]
MLRRIEIPAEAEKILTVADELVQFVATVRIYLPLLPVSTGFWGEEEISRSAGLDAHHAAVGRVASRSERSTSPVAPARTARPPRT